MQTQERQDSTQRTARAWAPAWELLETPDAYWARLELPGLDPQTVELTVDGDALTVRGERPEEARPGATPHVRELRYGRFERTLKLSRDVDVEQVAAESQHGVLTVRLPKASEAQPRTIPVQVR